MSTLYTDTFALSDHYRNEVGDLPAAIKVLEAVRPKIDTGKDDYYICVMKLAALYRDTGNIRTAEELYLKGREDAVKHDKPIFLADFDRALAFLYLHHGDSKQAQELTVEAEKTIAPYNSKEAVETKANVYATFGNIYFAEKRYKQALDSYRSALDFAKEIEALPRIITVTSDIANVYIEQEEYEDAAHEITKILSEAKKHYRVSVPSLLLRLAKVYVHQGDLKQAEKVCTKALNIAKKEGWQRDIAEAHNALGYIYLKQDNQTRAKRQLHQASKQYDKVGFHKIPQRT